jgi:hypothetical protein
MKRREMVRFVSVVAVVFGLLMPYPAHANEIWVAPTYQADFGGLGVGSSVVWPVTPAGAVRLAWAVPGDLQSFTSARLVLIPQAAGASTLTVFICAAQNTELVAAACAGPAVHNFTASVNQLTEVDVSASLGPHVGGPGTTYLSVLAFTAPTAATDRIVGLRFAYVPAPPAGVATLGANTFTGTQTAPAFVGNGSGLTNLPFPAGAATLGSNTFAGTQAIDTGSLDLDPSSATTGNILKNGTRFLHNFGGINATFLGENAGNFTMNPFGDNTGLGAHALSTLTTGQGNTAVGSRAMLNTTTGFQNVAVGRFALTDNTSGGDNTAMGDGALNSNTTGSSNTGLGAIALGQTTTGFNNTAVGDGALANNPSGSNNVAVGHIAGLGATTGSLNIYLGAAVVGSPDDSNTMRLGAPTFHTRTFIAGIRDVAVTGGEMVIIDADGQLGSGPVGPAANSVGANEVINDSLTASDLAPGAVTASELAANSVGTAAVAFNYAGSASEGGAASDLACAGCVAAGEVSFSFAGPGANTFTGTQTINAGSLDLDTSTAAAGNLLKNGQPFLHNFSSSTFLGLLAGNFTMTGAGNTATGFAALGANTTGSGNTATGSAALDANTTGDANTAIGSSALGDNTAGVSNTAIGSSSLANNTQGHRNTASGFAALVNNSVGADNVAVGYNAGANQTAGSNNIYLGANVEGVAGEINTMYLGRVGTQIRAYIAGVRGIPTAVPNAVPVVIDSLGQLGTINSSRRYKQDISDMGGASRRLLQLRPVTFRYTQAYADGSKPIQFGLIAEEVAETFPELAVRGADGAIETVHYEKLSVLLLNEMQRQQHAIEQQRRRIEALERQLNALVARPSVKTERGRD